MTDGDGEEKWSYSWEDAWVDHNRRHDTNGSTNGTEPPPPPTSGQSSGEPADTPYGLKALEGECATVAATGEGHRNQQLNDSVFKLSRYVPEHLSPTTILEAMGRVAQQVGLPQREIDKVLRSDVTSALVNGQHKAHRDVPDGPATPPVTELDASTVAGFWQARENLSHLHMFARSRVVAPWAVFGVTLTRIITATGHHVTIPPIVGSVASLNMFVATVGKSGAGKGAAESVSREAFDVGDITVRNTGSGEGLLHAFARRGKSANSEVERIRDAVLFSIPEIDSLGAVGARTGATLIPMLRQAWSGEPLGFQYADPTKNLPIDEHSYRLCLVAGVQPGRGHVLLNDTDGGLPQRWTWLPATDPGASDDFPSTPSPVTWKHPDVDAWQSIGGHHPLTVCQTATDIIRDNRLASVQGKGDALDGHALLARLKIACGLALMEQRTDVNDEDWELSGIVQQRSDLTRQRVIDHLSAQVEKSNEAKARAEATRTRIVTDSVESEQLQRVCRAILRKLERAEGEPVPVSDVRRTIRASVRRHFEPALDRLSETGQVVVTEVGKGRFACLQGDV